jgi:dTDP-4-dehydrorhamnose 3,5-epimerase
MLIKKNRFKKVLIINQIKLKDFRGHFREVFLKRFLKKKNFLFHYYTVSKKNVIRGLHFQEKFQQEKYIYVSKGKVLDIIVDLRKGSKTYGKHFSIILSEKNCKALFIPEGFAHGYYCFNNGTILNYVLTNYYKPKFENGIIWNDNDLKIKWPTRDPIISKKDKTLNTFKYFKKVKKFL